MKVHVKYAKSLLLIVSGLLAASIALFLTGNSGLILVVLAMGVVGYMIFAIGKSGMPGTETVEEQADREHDKEVQTHVAQGDARYTGERRPPVDQADQADGPLNHH